MPRTWRRSPALYGPPKRERSTAASSVPTPQSQRWRSVAGSPIAVAEFARDLTVEHPANTDNITVTYLDADPQVAAAAVNAVIASYAARYAAQDDPIDRQRLQLLQDQR